MQKQREVEKDVPRKKKFMVEIDEKMYIELQNYLYQKWELSIPKFVEDMLMEFRNFSKVIELKQLHENLENELRKEIIKMISKEL